MTVLAVLPFRAAQGEGAALDPDAHDLARWLAAETAEELAAARVVQPQLVLDEVEISAEALGAAAGQLGAAYALGAVLRLEAGQVAVSALLAGDDGQERAAWNETVALEGVPQLGRQLARAVLLALGEEASAPPETLSAEVPAEAVLRLVRAVRRLSEEPAEAAAELLALATMLPALPTPRRAVLAAARDAAGSDRMPVYLAALEELVERFPDDAEALLALGDYRALHFDEAGARELYLDARSAAPDLTFRAQALDRLAALAESAGRNDEAVLHLREAVKLTDQAGLYARLGALLLAKDSQEGLRMLTRASVLDPADPALHLQLLRALRVHGDDAERVLQVSAHTVRLCAGTDLAEQARAEVQLLLGES